MCEWRYQRSSFWLRFKFRVGSKEKRAKVERSSHLFIHLITFYPVLGTLVVQRSNRSARVPREGFLEVVVLV